MTHSIARFLRIAGLLCATLCFLPGWAEAQRGVPINIESVPPGAQVYVDSTDAGTIGSTPLTGARVVGGTHTLIFRLANHEEARLQVTVRRRRETFRVVLRGLGTVEVSAGNEGARGATVRIDGQPAGNGTLSSFPVRVENLTPGRHQIQVARDGYTPFETWVDVQAGQAMRVTAMLERAAPNTGSILVGSDVTGAQILLDGQAQGNTPSVLENVPPGTHALEVRADGIPPFTQQVLVQAGQRATVNATLRGNHSMGTIAVITDSPGARVRINGTELPAGTFTRDGLSPGNYVVQILAEGFQPVRREVTVTAGQTTSLDVELTRDRGPAGRINIVVNVPNARITVDNEERSAPYVVNEPTPGTHAVVVRAEGYQEQTFTCSSAPGTSDEDDCNRTVDMQAQQVALNVTVEGEVPGATVFIDNREMGPAPYEGRLAAGNHVIEVRAEGFQTYRRQLEVDRGEGDINITANMTNSLERAAAAAVTHSALPIPMDHPMIDISTGWPYLAELRLGIGLSDLLDAGFTFRSLFPRVFEFEARARVGVRVVRQLALGAQVRVGGGIGPSQGLGRPDYRAVDVNPTMTGIQQPNGVDPNSADGRLPATSSDLRRAQTFAVANGPSLQSYPVNNFTFSLEGLVSLMLEPVAAVTGWAALDFFSDEYSSHTRNAGAYADFNSAGETICTELVSAGSPSVVCTQQRQNSARFRLGLALEFAVDRHWNVWGIFEGSLGGDDRRLTSGYIGDFADIRLYPRLGITYKF